MTEYIKKEDALNAFRRVYMTPSRKEAKKIYTEQIINTYRQIESIPAADVAELKHGKWEKQWNTVLKAELPVCSCCKRLSVSDGYNYCPICGAIMDGDP